MTQPAAVLAFAAFALAYFLSTLLRGVTATLAPVFSAELRLGAAELGMLAGAYFLGFTLTQLPLGSALDRFGPRRVLLAFLAVAVAGCAAFAAAPSFVGLTLARVLIGVGVSACLMAPLTTFRHRFGPGAQLRANSWMLMVGSLGMVASTLPVQWLLPLLGWRGLFWGLAVAIVAAGLAIAVWAPADAARPAGAAAPGGYGQVWQNRTFQRFAPMAFFHYGGLIAIQSLWAGPWLVRVCGQSPSEAAAGLFIINVSMLLAFFAWGLGMPRLHSRGIDAQSLIRLGAPLSIALLFGCVALGERAGAAWWAAFCVSCTFISLSQPAVGQAFPRTIAGRALSAYNLLIFAGIFALQWGIGLMIDLLRARGWSDVSAHRGAIALLGMCMLSSYLWFLRHDDRIVERPAVQSS
ncbi:MAG: MFS transporter [Piscinibacter sp.]|nr:MFS transporter [Piscinibacter sp.]